MYEGTPFVPFAWHGEDCWLGSFNFCPSSKTTLEHELRRLPLLPAASSSRCDQFLWHDAIFGLGGLRKRGIRIRTFTQKEGQLVVIFSGAYHSGYSETYTKAEADNFADDSWNPDGYRICTPECSCHMPPITIEHMRLLRLGEEQVEHLEQDDEQELEIHMARAYTLRKRKRASPGVGRPKNITAEH
jgi:hypothetical protein